MIQTARKEILKPISYSFNTAIQISGFSRSRIYRGMKSGILPFKKVGKRTMFIANDFETFVLNELEREPAIPYSINANKGES